MILKTVPVTEDFPERSRLEALAAEAFPPAEYRAPAHLIEMAKAPDFDFLALYDGDAFVGYIAVQLWEELRYLFFLAIESGVRDRGYGARALETLRRLYPGTRLVLDLELLAPAAANAAQRARRRAFYLRNGYRPTGWGLRYFGVDYEILCGDDGFDIARFRRMLAALAVEGFDPRYFPVEL